MAGDGRVVHIIDDDAAVRESLEALLMVSGFEVAAYDSAEDYLARGDAVGGCIVLDLNMPGMGGLDLLAVFARREPLIPVVVLTASREARDAERAIELGARAFLNKPVREAALIDAILAAWDPQ
jgi:two-component system response regulator FixJ